VAKKSKVVREEKIKVLVKKFRDQRLKIISVLKDSKVSYEEKIQAQIALEKLPRNSSHTRLRNRCSETGRPRGVYRKFGLCRNLLREYLMSGYVPGAKKASW
jgi:small subunit ribosomal protein S14